MKTTLLTGFAVLTFFAVSPARADVSQAQETICTTGHHETTGMVLHPCGTINQQLAWDEDQRRGPGGTA